MSTVYIQKESVNHIILNNNTGSDLVQYEMTVIGGLSLIADEAIANGATGSFHVENGICFQTDDFEAGEDTFATVNQDVFWNPATGDFSDTETAGYYKVGVLKEIKNSNGVILVTKNRQAVYSDVFTLQAEMAVEQAEPKTLVFKVTADASIALPIAGLVEGDEIIDVHLICTAANASGTLTLEDGAGDDISDAMICAVDKVVVRAGTIDDAKSVLPATGAAIISVGGTATDTRGIVVISYIPA